jgi:hypothetical protein
MLVECFCTDPDVQQYVADEVCDVGLWPFKRKPKTANQIFREARQRYGDRRCLDLIIHQH